MFILSNKLRRAGWENGTAAAKKEGEKCFWKLDFLQLLKLVWTFLSRPPEVGGFSPTSMIQTWYLSKKKARFFFSSSAARRPAWHVDSQHVTDFSDFSTLCLIYLFFLPCQAGSLHHDSHIKASLDGGKKKKDLVVSCPPAERLQWEAGGASVPVHGVAGPRCSRVPHPLPGLPSQSKDLQPARRRTHHRPLQVSSNI